MFAVIFAFALATAYAAEIPSYINVCGRKDPNINKCVVDNINNLRDKICNGLTDLNLQPLEPLNIKRLTISDSPDSQVYINDVQITGVCDYNIKSFTADLDKFEFTIDVALDHVYLNGTYDINVHVLVPIVHKAPIYLTSNNAKLDGILHAEMVNKGGKNRLYISQLKTNIQLTGYEAKYGFKDEDLGEMGQVLGNLIGSNQQEFIDRLVPELEKEISKWVINIFNSVFKMFTYDELFPDRE